MAVFRGKEGGPTSKKKGRKLPSREGAIFFGKRGGTDTLRGGEKRKKWRGKETSFIGNQYVHDRKRARGGKREKGFYQGKKEVLISEEKAGNETF